MVLVGPPNHPTLTPTPFKPTHASIYPPTPTPSQVEYTRTGGGVQLSLNLPLTSIKTSLLTLSVAADNITFTTNRSPARIVSTQVGRSGPGGGMGQSALHCAPVPFY